MSDRLTFLWFVGTCNLGHLAMGRQEAFWNMVKEKKNANLDVNALSLQQQQGARDFSEASLRCQMAVPMRAGKGGGHQSQGCSSERGPASS